MAKAESAEQKAADARDDRARARAYRDAAHEWDRAADREKPGKQRDAYTRNAERNRELAEGDVEETPEDRAGGEADPPAGGEAASRVDPRFLN